MKTPIFLLFLHNKYSWNSTETDLTSIIVYNTEFRRNKDENLGFSIYYILCISNMFGQDHRERLGALVPTLMRYSATPAVCGYDHPYPFKSSSGKCMCSVWPIGTVTVAAMRSDCRTDDGDWGLSPFQLCVGTTDEDCHHFSFVSVPIPLNPGDITRHGKRKINKYYQAWFWLQFSSDNSIYDWTSARCYCARWLRYFSQWTIIGMGYWYWFLWCRPGRSPHTCTCGHMPYQDRSSPPHELPSNRWFSHIPQILLPTHMILSPIFNHWFQNGWLW